MNADEQFGARRDTRRKIRDPFGSLGPIITLPSVTLGGVHDGQNLGVGGDVASAHARTGLEWNCIV